MRGSSSNSSHRFVSVDAGHLSIAADADNETVQILVENGLDKCYPDAVAAWYNRARTNAKAIQDWKDAHHEELKKAAPSENDLRPLVRHAVITRVLDEYPYVRSLRVIC